MNAQIGMRAQDLAERNFDWNQKLTEQFSPTYAALLKNALGEATKNAERGDDQWNQYKNVFQPIENKMAEDAMNYDSPRRWRAAKAWPPPRWVGSSTTPRRRPAGKWRAWACRPPAAWAPRL